MKKSVALINGVYEWICIGWFERHLNLNKSFVDYIIGLKEDDIWSLSLNNLLKRKYVTLTWDYSKMLVLHNIRIVSRVLTNFI